MVTNNAINSPFPIDVANGGTGRSTNTANAVLCSGTTSTGNMQNTASAGTSGQILKVQQGGGLPVWKNNSIQMITVNTPAAASDSQFALSGYSMYWFSYANVATTTATNTFIIEVSDDAGGTWKTTGYYSSAKSYTDVGSSESTVTTAAQLCVTNTHDNTGNSHGNLYILNIGTSTTSSMVHNGGYPTGAGVGASVGIISGATFPSSLTINRIRFRMTAGTFSGTIYQYGIAT